MELEEVRTSKTLRLPVPVFEDPPRTNPAPSENTAADATLPPADATEDASEDATYAPIAKDARPTLPNAPEDATYAPITKDARPTLPNAPEDATHAPITPTIPNAPEDDTHRPMAQQAADAPGFHKTYTAGQDSQNPFPEEAMD